MNPAPVLWLDDDPARTEKVLEALPAAVTTETAEGMIGLLRDLTPTRPGGVVFLDHDLGGEVFVDPAREDTGMAVVRWIEANRPPVERFVVHSFNREAAETMVERLTEAGYETSRAPFGSADFLEILEVLVFGD